MSEVYLRNFLVPMRSLVEIIGGIILAAVSATWRYR